MASLVSTSLASVASGTVFSVAAAATTASASASASPSHLLEVGFRTTIGDTHDFFPFNDVGSLGGTSGDHAGRFSFNSAIKNDLDGNYKVYLFRSGCLIDGYADCARACSDKHILYGSFETLYNCATLATLSFYIQALVVTEEAEANASAVMGSSTLAGFDGRLVLGSLVMCAQASCNDDNLSIKCDPSIESLSHDSSPAAVLGAMDVFCPAVPAEINPDIFGPGVLVSYVLQIWLAACLWGFLKVFVIYVRCTQRRVEAKRDPPRVQPDLLKRAFTFKRINSLMWSDSGTLSRTSVAVASTLVNFQEAQCWFVFALQIASILAIIVHTQQGTFWGEIILNSGVAYHLSINGILPIFLIQICLHSEGIRNWHTFIGFFIEYILAIVATTQWISFDDTFSSLRSEHPIAACGGNPSPRTYCGGTKGVDGLKLSFFPSSFLYKIVFLILNTIAIIALVTDQVAWTLRSHRLTKNRHFGRYRLGRWPEHWTRTRAQWFVITRWSWYVLEVAYLFVNMLYMVSLLKVMNAESFAAGRWSYGQIIVMTVWGPIIVKLFDLIISGPPKNDGIELSSGPPRLRIDNIINRREGTAAAEEHFAFYDYRKRASRLEMESLASLSHTETSEGKTPHVLHIDTGLSVMSSQGDLGPNKCDSSGGF